MKKIKDSDLLEAMQKAVNNDLNIDPLYFKTIDQMTENEPTKHNGQYIDYDGLDVQNLKHPFFDK